MYTPLHIFQSVFTIVFYASFFISAILVIVGIFGIVLSSIKHYPMSKWVNKLKVGSATLIGSVILYTIIQYINSALGFGISSFTGDTQVWTPKGRVRIAELNVGDEVMGYDIKTNTIVTEKIEQCSSYKVNSYYLINGTLKATSEHPFAVRDSGNIIWKKVSELAVEDVLVAAEMIVPLVIESIEEESISNSITVYNPQVSGGHNYFVYVKNNAALVHNKTKLPTLKPQQRCNQDK